MPEERDGKQDVHIFENILIDISHVTEYLVKLILSWKIEGLGSSCGRPRPPLSRVQLNFIFEIYLIHYILIKTSNSVSTEVPYLSSRILNEKSFFFLRPQLSLKSKTNTIQQQIGNLVYPEITQISERSV